MTSDRVVPDNPPPNLTLHPIGVVRNRVKEPRPDRWGDVESEIVVEEKLTAALDGLEDFSHVIVLFWLHRVPEKVRRLKLRPRDRADLPLVGVFATRSQLRPNPLGVSVVPLLRRRGNILRVLGLDAIDGTPVLDLKPHLPRYDTPPGARQPRWMGRGSSREIADRQQT